MRLSSFSGSITMAISAVFQLACGPAVGEARIGAPRPPKPENCTLQFASISDTDTQQGGKFGAGGEYEGIGVVMIGADEGTDAMSEKIREIVRPKACAMGGEMLSLAVSGVGANRRGHPQQNIVFQVWARRKATPALTSF
ncbi:hypothetical protein [Pendulispora albinea]|uniref:Uncharacterized protein n=1 Tax=Pendulispora albinea TaxID=2741071 RepID=A0ABZ2LZS0_9BACT